MIKKDSKVTIHYALSIQGVELESSKGGEPLEYVHGGGQIIPGLEESLEGLKAGEKSVVTVSPDKGYGEHNPDAVQQVPKSAFHGAEQLTVGEVVMGSSGGREFQAKVVAMDDDTITVDLNHPLAGKTLEFAIEVVSVE
ncbi:MAG: FKBP-type peptidyl-prolyl cis-trans isomerase [Planctomycetota bacterium]